MWIIMRVHYDTLIQRLVHNVIGNSMLFPELNYIQLKFGAKTLMNYEAIGLNVILYNLIHRIRIQIRILLIMLHSRAVVNCDSLT